MHRHFAPLAGLLFCTLLVLAVGIATAQDDGTRTDNVDNSGFGAPDPDRPVGVTVMTDEVQDGYILLSLIQSKDVMLLSNDGRIVNRWEGDEYLGQSNYLLENGDMIRTVSVPDIAYGQGGQWGFTGGRVEQYSWDGDLIWSTEYYDDTLVPHHDIALMPNGNILLIVFVLIDAEDALAAGRNPNLIPEEVGAIWSEKIIEINPDSGEIVWEWHVWDHLVQDYDAALPNYGVVSEHPERINLNYPDSLATDLPADWLHINSIAYNAELDQIIVSPRTVSEFWIIDHSTTTEEARGEAGDLLYRWGNPAAYNGGTEADRDLYFQHNPHWIADGLLGAGHVLVFDNGSAERPYSTIIEIELPIDEDGSYIMEPGVPTGPDDYVWQYVAAPPETFYSSLISGAQRQPNGNTLIAEGLKGRIFEVNPDGDIVWEYYLPPATWAFRAERYDLSDLDVDLSGDLGFAGGIVWGVDCVDGTRPRLYEYLIQDNSNMQLFNDTYGDEAQDHWEDEACMEHGGRADSGGN